MAEQNNKRPTVWQDVRRVQPAPSQQNKKATPKNKITSLHPIIFIKQAIKKNITLKINNKNRLIAITSLVVITVILTGFLVKTNIFDKNLNPEQIKIEELAAKKPQFKTFLPQGKTIDELGGWHKLTPPNSGAVFVYLDQIDSVRIRVTQQTMPEDFMDDKNAQIEQLAKNFKADEKITVGETIAYVGTNVNGVQSIIFEKNNTLILITSSAKIESKSWANYIQKLN